MRGGVRSAPLADRTQTRSRPLRGRAFTVWVVTLTVLLALLFTTVTALTVTLWLADPGYTETSPVVDLGFFTLGGILITSGLASQVRTPQRHVAGLQQSIVALLTLAVVGYLGGRVEPFIGSIVLLGATVPVVVAHPSRRRLAAAGQRVSRPLAAMALAAFYPALNYASSMLDHARSAGPSCFLGQCVQGDRFAEMAALAVAMALVALLASLETPGWAVPAHAAGIAALVLGGVSLALPGEVGALGPLGATATAGWGTAFVVLAHMEARRDASAPRGKGADRNAKDR